MFPVFQSTYSFYQCFQHMSCLAKLACKFDASVTRDKRKKLTEKRLRRLIDFNGCVMEKDDAKWNPLTFHSEGARRISPTRPRRSNDGIHRCVRLGLLYRDHPGDVLVIPPFCSYGSHSLRLRCILRNFMTQETGFGGSTRIDRVVQMAVEKVPNLFGKSTAREGVWC